MPIWMQILMASGILLFLGGLAALARALIEPRLLTIDRIIISVPISVSSENAVPSTDPASDETLLRVAFFSDIHGKGCKVPLPKLLDGIFQTPCDAVLFAGDIADSCKKPAEGLHILRAVSDRARRSGIPCFAVRGNHDRLITSDQARNAGFRLLVDEYVEIEGASGARFLLIGVDDPGKKNRFFPGLPTDLPSDFDADRRIVLVHNPDFVFSQTEPPHYRYQLSGHLHGGQIALPLIRLMRISRGDRLPKEGFLWGPLQKNGVSGYVTRGVGCGMLPLRLFSKPQVVHLSFMRGMRAPENR